MKKNKFYFLAFIIAAFGLFACREPKPTKDNSTVSAIDPATAGVQKLDTSLYEILAIKQDSSAQNFFLLFKPKTFDNRTITEFAIKFRAAFCTAKCNISFYDARSALDLITKDSLSNSGYLQLADHNIAASPSETSEVTMYPMQDIKYKKLGGKNWKKEHNF